MKITKREVMFFIAGILTMLIVETVCDWNGSKTAFQNGLEDSGKILKP
ncbi:hypothetical protein JSO62_01710 [Riemerella anatipestifer]